MKRALLAALMAVLLLTPLLFYGCDKSTAPDTEGLAIYLTRKNIPPSEMEARSYVEIADTPVISEKDIVAYHWDTHEIELTAEARHRIEKLEVPVSGKSFLVCVDRQPVYWGAFWVGFSSLSFNRVTIWTAPPLYEKGIAIRLGYPNDSFSSGADPRSNPLIKDALEKAGKLK